MGFLPRLSALYLHNNQMTGNINKTISDFYKLEDLRAYSNSLTGFIPDTIGAMTRLTTLMLDSNSLKGTNIDKAINNFTDKSPKAKVTQGTPVA